MKNLAAFLTPVIFLSTLSISGCANLHQEHENDPVKHVGYALRDIKTGTIITADDVVMKEIPGSSMPADAAPWANILEQRAAYDIATGNIIGVRDIDQPYTPEMLQRLTIDEMPKGPGPTASVIIATRDVPADQAIVAEDLTTADIASKGTPIDAMSTKEHLVGRQCKFAIQKGQLLMQHDLKAK